MVRIPPPVWTLLLLALASAASLLVAWRAIAYFPIVPLGAALIVLGIALSVSAAMLFRAEGTELNPASESNRKLVVGGAFRFTRNPMYLGLVLLTLGIAFWVGTPPMFVVPILVFAIANWAHIPFEEAKMRRQFGSAFDDYTQRVRRWI